MRVLRWRTRRVAATRLAPVFDAIENHHTAINQLRRSVCPSPKGRG